MKELIKGKKVVLTRNALTNIPNIAIVASTIRIVKAETISSAAAEVKRVIQLLAVVYVRMALESGKTQ